MTCTVCKDPDLSGVKLVHTTTNKGLQTAAMMFEVKQPAILGHDVVNVVAFRGTVEASVEDWLEDFEYKGVRLDTFVAANHEKDHLFMKPCGSCAVHEGFLNAYMSLHDATREWVSASSASLSTAETPVYITGHSLGASMAALATYDLLSMPGNSIQGVYTFGQPRTGNIYFAQAMKSLATTSLTDGFWRVTHWQDIVPHVPMMFTQYYHMPTEVFFDEPMTSHTVCDSSGEDPNCSDRFPIDLSIADHLNYLGAPMGLTH